MSVCDDRVICVITGESKEITVSFCPDHASELYADQVSVEINSGVSLIILEISFSLIVYYLTCGN